MKTYSLENFGIVNMYNDNSFTVTKNGNTYSDAQLTTENVAEILSIIASIATNKWIDDTTSELAIDNAQITALKSSIGKELGHINYAIFSNAIDGIVDTLTVIFNDTGKLATYSELFDAWNKPTLQGLDFNVFEALIDLKLARYDD